YTVIIYLYSHFFTLTPPPEIYPLSLHDALPICANVSGRAPAATMADARTQLGGAVSVYLDGGPSEHAVASTIVDVSAGAPRILREGAVAAERVAEVLGVDAQALRA